MADLLNDADIDFDRAASAFPDISLDGDDFHDFSSPPPAGRNIPTSGPFDLDDTFGTSAPPAREVKVTGHDDDEIGKFESEFPELDITPQVRPAGLLQRGLATDDDTLQVTSPPVPQPTFGAAAPFAPRPQPSALSATPILTQQIDAEEPEVIRCVLFVTCLCLHALTF